jgi:hypothetical protein
LHCEKQNWGYFRIMKQNVYIVRFRLKTTKDPGAPQALQVMAPNVAAAIKTAETRSILPGRQFHLISVDKDGAQG